MKAFKWIPLLITLTLSEHALPASPTPTPNKIASGSKSNLSQLAKQIWNLQEADIRAVIETISEITGKSFIIDPRVQGKITFVSSKPMTKNKIYSVFLSILQVMHYSAIPMGDVIKIIPAIDAKGYGGTFVTHDNNPQGDQVAVRVIPVKGSAMELVNILRPLMLEWGSINAYLPSNSLIIEGNAANINQLVEIIHNLDNNDNSTTQVVHLHYADATKLEQTFQALELVNKMQGKASNVGVVANAEENTLLISGNLKNRKRILRLIGDLDSKQAAINYNTSIVHLNYLTAKKVARILTKLAHGYIEQAKNNSILKLTTPNAESNAESLVSIQAVEDDNTIVMRGPRSIVSSLKNVIKKIDHRPAEVLVQAIIVKIDETMLSQLGIQWGIGKLNPAANLGDMTNSQIFQNGVGVIRNGSLTTLITALMNNANTDILSTPTVLVLNNQKAMISDGKNVGMLNREYSTSIANTTASAAVPFNTYERRDVTLSLNVTPQIASNRTLKLTIKQRDDSLAQDVQNPTPNNPTLNTSKINTSVLVNSGDILVLGGLISDSDTSADQKIPILGDIPLLGRLFHYKNHGHEKKNLMIFIRPIIINDKSQADQQSVEKYQDVRDQQLLQKRGYQLNENTQDPVLPPLANKHNKGHFHPIVLPPPDYTDPPQK